MQFVVAQHGPGALRLCFTKSYMKPAEKFCRCLSVSSTGKHKQHYDNTRQGHMVSTRRCYAKNISKNRHSVRTRSSKQHTKQSDNIKHGGMSRFGQNYKKNGKKDLSSIVEPIRVKIFENPDDIDVGFELTGKTLVKDDILTIISKFYLSPHVKSIAAANGIDSKLFHRAYVSFRQYCANSEALPAELHVTFSDILQGGGHVDDLFPFFLNHAKQMFPHLDCMEDLQKISDLTLPANWYPEARAIQRKVIFHAGPTNSGKTHHALISFANADCGVYCGPLRLLANEVFQRTNTAGTACDLVTGEERRFISDDGSPCNHVACTVEMTMTHQPYDVAVIDEIQMIRDNQRGWAWTRALLGVCAHEVHLCGEASAIPLVQDLLCHTGDTLEIRKYKRLTSLTVLDKAVGKFENVKDGDCIVCFSKNDIYHVSRKLEQMGTKCAVIYGTLPAGTKVAQAQMFNDSGSDCNVMVATDAVGMGINLNIKRIIFYSVVKPNMTRQGEMEMSQLPVSLALQIAGRAGRYGTQYADGEVTTFYANDLPTLHALLEGTVDEIQQAGLNPTAEQIELFAYHLPKATLSNLIDMFMTVAQMDNNLYFMCNMDDFKFLADMIEHIPLPLRTRYVFCCAPISKKNPFTCSMFLRFARQFSQAEALTCEWLGRQLDWPLKIPKTIDDLVHLEAVYDVLDLYLWLSYRFQDMLPHQEEVREMQNELDEIIQLGVVNITRLIEAKESRDSAKKYNIDDNFSPIMHKQGHEERVIHGNRKKVKRNKHLASTSDDRSQTGAAQLTVSQMENINPHNSDKLSQVNMSGEMKLTTQLLELGILTDKMMEKLKQELSGSAGNDNRTKGEPFEQNKVKESVKKTASTISAGSIAEKIKDKKKPRSLKEQYEEAAQKHKAEHTLSPAEQFQKECLSLAEQYQQSVKEAKDSSSTNYVMDDKQQGTDTPAFDEHKKKQVKGKASIVEEFQHALGDKSSSNDTTEKHVPHSHHIQQDSSDTDNVKHLSLENDVNKDLGMSSSVQEPPKNAVHKFQELVKGFFVKRNTKSKK